MGIWSPFHLNLNFIPYNLYMEHIAVIYTKSMASAGIWIHISVGRKQEGLLNYHEVTK